MREGLPSPAGRAVPPKHAGGMFQGNEVPKSCVSALVWEGYVEHSAAVRGPELPRALSEVVKDRTGPPSPEAGSSVPGWGVSP